MANTPKPRAKPDALIDSEVVRELALILNETGLTEIEVERGDLRMRVAKESEPRYVTAAASPVAAPPPASAPVAPAPSSAAPETPAPSNAADARAHPGAVPSPMVGTVYLSPEPDTPAFIEVGASVKEGDPLLLIEAMKTFNPIPAPRSGTVAEILVQDGEPVEFGQALVILS